MCIFSASLFEKGSFYRQVACICWLLLIINFKVWIDKFKNIGLFSCSSLVLGRKSQGNDGTLIAAEGEA